MTDQPRPDTVPVSYVQPDGRRSTHRVAVGDTVLDGALDNGVPGIVGQCGGGCTCATCHCYLRVPDPATLPASDADELALLEYVPERRAESRLACQLRIEASMTAVVVEVPSRQG